MIVVGVDPGKAGAIAALAADGSVVEVLPTPLILAGKTGRDEYDLVAIAAWFRACEDPFVIVEKGQPLPPKMKGGTVANFARGVARGWEWMLVGLQIRYQLVAPRVWQQAMHAGTPIGETKQRSLMAARRLFPSQSLLRSERCRTPDDGIAEALLIAEYGRRLLVAT